MNIIPKIKTLIKKFFYNLGFNIERNTNKNNVMNFISDFQLNYISTDLIRVGGDFDGGYLLPNILDNIDYCFSAGVGDTSKFEKDLSNNYNIKSFMIDGSVNSPSIDDKNFFFFKKYLSSKTKDEFITLSDWILKYLPEKNKKIILQMDIEGAEYEVLAFEPNITLTKFSILIVEFHKLENISNPIFYKMINSIFNKLYQNFKICHTHPNNFSGIYKFKNIEIPSSIEVTFIRNDLVDNVKSNNEIFLPHDLDQKNIKNIKKIDMPKIWWKKK